MWAYAQSTKKCQIPSWEFFLRKIIVLQRDSNLKGPAIGLEATFILFSF